MKHITPDNREHIIVCPCGCEHLSRFQSTDIYICVGCGSKHRLEDLIKPKAKKTDLFKQDRGLF